MQQLPSVRQLRYFDMLERLSHFGRAAEACFVSQSAFSVAIRDLETRLGVQLVDRNNRRVTITPIGRQIAARARLCLQDLTQLAELAAETRAPLSGRLTLGVIPTIAPFLLPRVLPEIRRRYPALRLYIREGMTSDLHRQLLGGELDLVLIALPWSLPGVELMTLFRDRFRLACRDGTQLMDPRKFSVNRVTAESILLLEDGHCLRDHALEACRVRNLESVSRFSASSLYTLLEMVNNDLGVTFLPEIAENSALLTQTRIRTWPLAARSYREIALGWRETTARAGEFRALGKLIAEHGTPGRSLRPKRA